jgi:hypothetical protein
MGRRGQKSWPNVTILFFCRRTRNFSLNLGLIWVRVLSFILSVGYQLTTPCLSGTFFDDERQEFCLCIIEEKNDPVNNKNQTQKAYTVRLI